MSWNVSFDKRFLATPPRLYFSFIPPDIPPDDPAIVGYEIRFFSDDDVLLTTQEVSAADLLVVDDVTRAIDVIVPLWFEAGSFYKVQVIPFNFYRHYLEASDIFRFQVPHSLDQLRFWAGPGVVVDDSVEKVLHYSFKPMPTSRIDLYSWYPAAVPVVSERQGEFGVEVLADPVVTLKYGITLFVDDKSVWLSHTLPERQILGWLSNNSLVSGTGIREGLLRAYTYSLSASPDTYIYSYEKISLDGVITIANLPDSFFFWVYKESGDLTISFVGSDGSASFSVDESFGLFSFRDGKAQGTSIGDIDHIELSGNAVLYAFGVVYSTGRTAPLLIDDGRSFFAYEVQGGAFDISDTYFVMLNGSIQKVELSPTSIFVSSADVSSSDSFVSDVSVSYTGQSYIACFVSQDGTYEHKGPAVLFLDHQPTVIVPDLSSDSFEVFIKHRLDVNVPRLIFDILGTNYSSGHGEFPYGDYQYYSLLQASFLGDVFYFADDSDVPTQGYVYPSGVGLLWTSGDYRGVVDLLPHSSYFGGTKLTWAPTISVILSPKVIASLYFGYADQLGSIVEFANSLFQKLILPDGDVEPSTFWKKVYNFPKRPDMSWDWWNNIARAISNNVQRFGEPNAILDTLNNITWVDGAWYDGLTNYRKFDFYSANFPVILPSGARALSPGTYKICLSAFVKDTPQSRGAENKPYCTTIKLFEEGFLIVDFKHAYLGINHPSGKLYPDGYRLYVYKDNEYLGYVKAIEDYTIPYYHQQTNILVSNGYFSTDYAPVLIDLSAFDVPPVITAVRQAPYLRAESSFVSQGFWFSLNIKVADDYPLNHYDLSVFSKIIYSLLPINIAVRTTVLHNSNKYQFWSELSPKEALHFFS